MRPLLLRVFLLASLFLPSAAPAHQISEETPSLINGAWYDREKTALGTFAFETEFMNPQVVADEFRQRDFWDAPDRLPQVLISMLETELASPLDPASSVESWAFGIIDDTLRRQVVNAYVAELIGYRERHVERSRDIIYEPDMEHAHYQHDTLNVYDEQPGVGKFRRTRNDPANVALLDAYVPHKYRDFLLIEEADKPAKLLAASRLSPDDSFVALCGRYAIMQSMLPSPDIYASRGADAKTYGPYSAKEGYALAEAIRAAGPASARPGLPPGIKRDPLSVNVLVTMAVARLVCWEDLGIATREQALREHVAMLVQAAGEGAQQAVSVLRSTMRREIDARPHRWDEFARDPLLRRLTTLYLERQEFFGNQPGNADIWLSLLEKAGTHDEPFCLHLAAVFESDKNEQLCERALAMAPAEHPEAHYLRSRLLLDDFSQRIGHLQAALEGYEKSRPKGFSPELSLHAGNERFHTYPYEIDESLDRETLIRLEYVDAMLVAGFFPDACRAARKLPEQLDVIYIADVLLSIDQLREVAEESCQADYDVEMDRERPVIKISENHHGNEISLRMILARRLFQANRYDEACRYLPKCFKEGGLAYAKWMRVADDNSRPPGERGQAMRKAAGVLSENREIWCTTGGYGWYFGWERIPHYQHRRDTSRMGADEPPRVETERIESAQSRITPDFANNRSQIGMLCLQASFLLTKEEAAETLVFGYGQSSRFYPAIANVMRNRLLTDFGGTQAAKSFFTPDPTDR
jgi:hypothetical protein